MPLDINCCCCGFDSNRHGGGTWCCLPLPCCSCSCGTKDETVVRNTGGCVSFFELSPWKHHSTRWLEEGGDTEPPCCQHAASVWAHSHTVRAFVGPAECCLSLAARGKLLVLCRAPHDAAHTRGGCCGRPAKRAPATVPASHGELAVHDELVVLDMRCDAGDGANSFDTSTSQTEALYSGVGAGKRVPMTTSCIV